MEPKVFISHASSDRDFASEIASSLERIGVMPWLDSREISPGDSFLGEMNVGLGTAGYVLLLLSAASQSSRWVRREWLSALADEATVLVPILLDDSGLPPLLKDIVYIDARPGRACAIEAILRFFQKETERPRPTVRRDVVQADSGLLSVLTPRQLRMVAVRCLDRPGLAAFCLDAGMDPNDLSGESVNEKLVALMHSIVRDGLLKKFGLWLEFERPRCVTHQIAELRKAPGWDWELNRD